VALLREVVPDRSALLREVDEFRHFLTTKPHGERKEFLPFFTKHPQLCVYLGSLNGAVRSATHTAAEFSLWGDFTCDLMAGSPHDKAFVCIEFEDAVKNSVFRPEAGRKNSHWGTRAEHGISQVNDWLFRISREVGADVLERDLGARHVNLMGVVVIGRSADISTYDRLRLDWRSQNSSVGGAHLNIFTYDDLFEWLEGRLAMLRAIPPSRLQSKVRKST
jgi:Shedu protein SduA, C-terminal